MSDFIRLCGYSLFSFQGAACREELEEHERNCQLLSSALSDKSAQLQLQEARVEVRTV